MLKSTLIVLALIAPGAALVFFTLQPAADIVISIPIAHFYIVTFITFSAAVISILLAASLGQQAQARHVLAAAAFGVIGGIFFSHGLATPNALIAHTHPAVRWSAWLTLFGSGLLFALAGLDHPQAQRPLPVRPIVLATIVGVAGYSAIAAFFPAFLTAIEAQADPWMRYVIFGISLLLWVFAAVRLGLIWRVTRNPVDGILAFVAVWLATANFSMHLFAVWHLSWWVYHLTFLAAFLITAFFLARAYEQVRQFQLLRYYLAASLILTALLALAASVLFTSFAYNTLEAEMRDSARTLTTNLATGLANDLSDVTDAAALQKLESRPGMRGLLARRLSGLTLAGAFIYDSTGLAVYADPIEWVGTRAEATTAFATALQGQPQVLVRAPSETPTSYGPSNATHVIFTFAPLYPAGDVTQAPIGVLSLAQEAPTLNAAILQARSTGLVTAAVSMGLLFLALLTVVGRADGIITSRTAELRQVSARLKTYSEWLLGKDLLQRLLADPNALSLNRQERTVLFMDIRGFTAWSESRSPEQVVAMLNRYYNATEAVMSRHRAIKFKFAADEAMAVFAEAATAVQAARELRAEIAALFADQHLGAGIGLHTGPLVEGLLGSVDLRFYDVIGDTVNTAKRIEGAAARAEVLLSDSTRQAVGTSATFGPSRAITAKGKEEPVIVYPLV